MSTPIELAQFLLLKAVDLDEKGRWTESLNYYQEGVTALLKYVREVKEKSDQEKIRDKIETYIKRAELLKQKLETKKTLGGYHEQIEIEHNSINHSYEQVFGRFLDDNVYKVDITDPYIHNRIQCHQFLQFCELLVKKCSKLQTINLLTSKASSTRDGSNADFERQDKNLKQIQSSLKQYRITLNINYSNTLHDREIVLSNDWIIKIGRGLDYFQNTSEFSVGYTDFSLRKCRQTTVDIFNKTSLVK